MGWMKDETGLEKTAANFVPLTPLSHLNRAKQVYPDRLAVAYGDHRVNYAQYHERVTRLASGLAKIGIVPGDVVATLLPNVPAQVEAQFGVPACAAVLNTINTRLDVSTVAYIFDHGEAKAVLVDSALLPLAEAAISEMDGPAPKIIEVPDAHAGLSASGKHMQYEDLIASGDADFQWVLPEDEWESLALNYTSGTTGRPKGVVYHHRGAYLMTMGTLVSWQMGPQPVYLTIVPLFHCNGWNHSWMIPIVGGTIICCRDVTASNVFNAIADEGVTHFGGAPIVLNTLVNCAPEERRDFDHVVEVYTAGAPPAPATLAKVAELGMNVSHVYALTETYGHVTECLWQNDRWASCDDAETSAIKSRQGVAMPMVEPVAVRDSNKARSIATQLHRAKSNCAATPS